MELFDYIEVFSASRRRMWSVREAVGRGGDEGISEAVSHPNRGLSMRRPGGCMCVVMAFASSLLSIAQSRAESSPDTSYCWPTVVARGAHGKPPVSGRVQAYRVEETGSDSVRWVEEAGFSTVLTDGRAEIVGVLAGRYLVNLRGVYAERPLANWRGYPIVSEDTWRRSQARGFEAWAEWNVVHGNCADSIVVRVRPGEWLTPTGELMIDSRRPIPPAPYRIVDWKHRRSTGSKP